MLQMFAMNRISSKITLYHRWTNSNRRKNIPKAIFKYLCKFATNETNAHPYWNVCSYWYCLHCWY